MMVICSLARTSCFVVSQEFKRQIDGKLSR